MMKTGTGYENSFLTELAELRRIKQQFAEAELILREMVASIDRMQLPATMLTRRAERQRDLALVVELQGRSDEAKSLRDDALKVLKQRPRFGDIDEAKAIQSRGDEFRRNRQFAQAEVAYQSAANVTEAALGLNHPAVADLYDKIAAAQIGQGRNKCGRVLKVGKSDPRAVVVACPIIRWWL